MEYDKEFEEWFGSRWISGYFGSTRLAKDAAWYAWQAARKDHYRIGEEVEVSFNYSPVFELAKVGAIAKTCNEYDPDRVRRTPAKSRIDEIAEEAKDLYMATSAGDRDRLTHIIKSAILQARKEWEAER